MRRITSDGWIYATCLAITLLICAVYLPYLNSELVFDDANFFYRTGAISHYAVTPFNLSPRTFPYFTFSFIQTVFQSFEAQRVFNLGLHVANFWMLCVTLVSLHAAAQNLHQGAQRNSVDPLRVRLIAVLVAAAFALHPVAVYGAAYLVQRTILFATFFALLSIIFYVRHLSSRALKPLAISAFFASAAIFSKEHAVLLPFALVLLAPALGLAIDRRSLRNAALFLLLCSPALLAVILALKGVVAMPYEPHVTLLVEDTGSLPWLRSVLTQCALFFRYLGAWFVPDTSTMSADVRLALVANWADPRALAWAAAFLMVGLVSLALTLRGRRHGLAAFGLLFVMVLFLVELSTIRVQEPFVLYRSYLWAPGLAIFAFALVLPAPRNLVIATLIVALPVLSWQAIDRLESLKTSTALWADAAAKLESEDAPGAYRVFYNRGQNHLGAGRYEPALEDMERCRRLSPGYAGCRLGMAIVHERTGSPARALEEVEAAIDIDPKNAVAWETKGRLLTALGRDAEAGRAFAVAEGLGGSIGSLIRKQREAANTNR